MRDNVLPTEDLLLLLRDLVAETRGSGATRVKVGPYSLLDLDLGIDSLARVELLRRVEAKFGVALDERIMADVETPNDLLEAIAGAAGIRPETWDREPPPGPDEHPDAPPAEIETLLEALAWHVEHHPGRNQILLYGNGSDPLPITYRNLYDGARAVASGLVRIGAEPGTSVAIMLPTSREYFFTFYGILFAGGVPVPLYPPTRAGQFVEHLKRQRGIIANAEARIMVTSPEIAPVAKALRAGGTGLRHVVAPEELIRNADPGVAPHPARKHETAFLQYTSGSTGRPKGVVLSHGNLLANLRAMGGALDVTSRDVFVSWLPLYHDMGLIGAALGTMYFAAPLVLMSPLRFLVRPARWLRAIHRHRATLSASPNFGYELAISKIGDDVLEHLDLSSWRCALNGAEPVSPRTIRRFTERFGRCGFRASAMTPVYGLAESSVGLAFPRPCDRMPTIDRVARVDFAERGRADPATDGDAVEFVGCGRALDGHEMRIVDENDRELADRRQGNIQFKGPSSTSGYFRNPEANRNLLRGEWRDTGDLGYIAGGELFITGRRKDLVIRAGRNIHPHEIEEAIGDLPGVRKGSVAVFGAPDPESETERLVVVAETRSRSGEEREKMHRRIAEIVLEYAETPPDDVVLVPAHTVPKTSSGKIRRSSAREYYIEGTLEKRGGARFAKLRVLIADLRGAAREGAVQAREAFYNAWVWTLFALIAPLGWVLVAVLPSRRLRWAVVRGSCRAIVSLARIPFDPRLPAEPARGPTVYVINHSSYADVAFVTAALPAEIVFAVKAEFRSNFVTHIFLGRLGAEFVERFDRERGREDVRRIVERLRGGESLAVFPEGTFYRGSGILPFRMGAFVVAAEAGMPVVPVALGGTRSLLRSDQWFFRRTRVRLAVGAPVYPGGPDWGAAIELRDRARAFILEETGEPDLG